MSFKNTLAEELKKHGAFDVRIADPLAPIEYARPECLPIKIWPDCKSVIVFITASAVEANNTFICKYSIYDGAREENPIPKSVDLSKYAYLRLNWVVNDHVALRCVRFLQKEGYQGYANTQSVQRKLYAWHSGIGVYGRSGLILNPTLGNRLSIGIILTDVKMEADPMLEGFNPCEHCNKCVRSCPAGAYGTSGTYHNNWSEKKCADTRREIVEKGYYCHNCFAVCPAGKIKDGELNKLFNVKSWIDFEGR